MHCRRETPNVRLAIRSKAASVWSVNGKQVIAICDGRQTCLQAPDGEAAAKRRERLLLPFRCGRPYGNGIHDQRGRGSKMAYAARIFSTNAYSFGFVFGSVMSNPFASRVKGSAPGLPSSSTRPIRFG